MLRCMPAFQSPLSESVCVLLCDCRMVSCNFPHVLDRLKLKAFDLSKVIQSFVKYLPSLPRCACLPGAPWSHPSCGIDNADCLKKAHCKLRRSCWKIHDAKPTGPPLFAAGSSSATFSRLRSASSRRSPGIPPRRCTTSSCRQPPRRRRRPPPHRPLRRPPTRRCPTAPRRSCCRRRERACLTRPRRTGQLEVACRAARPCPSARTAPRRCRASCRRRH
jgi:hypothetical protein